VSLTYTLLRPEKARARATSLRNSGDFFELDLKLHLVRLCKAEVAMIQRMFFVGLVVSSVLACQTAQPAHAAPLRKYGGPYSVEILAEGQRSVPTFYHRGEHFILGRKSERYTLRIHNRTARRIEAVVSVDGRDVLDGKRASYQKRGYIVPAWSYIDVDGWRLSNQQVAAFRFSSVSESYAAKTGDAFNVGVIGVAVFPEKVYEPVIVSPPVYPDEEAYRTDDVGEPSIYGGASAEGKGESAKPRSRGQASPAKKSQAAMGQGSSSRPGLGTEFGEVRHSHVTGTSFERASLSPSTTLGLRYNDRRGLVAGGIDVDGYYRQRAEAQRRLQATPFAEEQRTYATPPPGWHY